MDHITIKPFCDIIEFKTLSPGQIISKVQRRMDNSGISRIEIFKKRNEYRKFKVLKKHEKTQVLPVLRVQQTYAQ